jgi:crossover junction endodeoxyribonuclease RuvC
MCKGEAPIMARKGRQLKISEASLSVIIGIDPGSLRTGWGVIQIQKNNLKCLGYGVIDLTHEESFSERLAKLHSELSEIIEKFQPKAMSIEKVFFGKNADSAFKLGHARGVAMSASGLASMPVAEYATRYVKKVLTGNGAAAKEQVQFMVNRLLNIEIQVNHLDASDALALAVCHSRQLHESSASATRTENKSILEGAT